MKTQHGLLAGLVVLAVASAAAADVPTTIGFTGRLTTSAGPVEGPVRIELALYDAPADGAAVWTEVHTPEVDHGLVQLVLGETTPLDADVFDQPGALYLQLTVGGDGTPGTGEVLGPRAPIHAVPYATVAGSLGSLRPDDVVSTITTAPSSGVAIARTAGQATVGLTPCSAGQHLRSTGAGYQCADLPTVDLPTYAGQSPITVSAGVIGLAPGGIGTGHLAAGAVTAETIAEGAIGAEQLATGIIGTDHLADGSVGQDDLAPNAVTSGHIANGSIVADDLADASVTATKLAGAAVGSHHIVDATILAEDIAAGAIGSAQIADNAVTMSKVVLPLGSGTATSQVSTSGTFVAATTVTPPASGTCQVTAQARASLSTSATSSWATLVPAYHTGGSAIPIAATVFDYFVSTPATSGFAGRASASVTLSVTGGTTYSLGCSINFGTGSVYGGVGYTCMVTYICV